jgi:calpain-15
VLAEYPKRIKRLFVQDKQNNYGVYAVKICKNGEWKEVVIDDYIPCHNGKPCFSKANGNELWVLLLEKAWAKLHGSYERIEAGFAENVLHDLTGAPTEVIETDDQNLFEKLKNSDKNKWVMAASAGSTEASKEVLTEIGLIGNHSYGLIDVIEFKDMNEDTI